MNKTSADQIAKILKGKAVNVKGETHGVMVDSPTDALLQVMQTMQQGLLNADELEELELPEKLSMVDFCGATVIA